MYPQAYAVKQVSKQGNLQPKELAHAGVGIERNLSEIQACSSG
jgi:hypothetical protein